jgi:hypothetical protein
MELVLTLAVFGTAMLGMSVGVIVSNRRLRGSCGGPDVVTSSGDAMSCGACPKKEAEVCASDDPLIALAQIANPNPRH